MGKSAKDKICLHFLHNVLKKNKFIDLINVELLSVYYLLIASIIYFSLVFVSCMMLVLFVFIYFFANKKPEIELCNVILSKIHNNCK